MTTIQRIKHIERVGYSLYIYTDGVKKSCRAQMGNVFRIAKSITALHKKIFAY